MRRLINKSSITTVDGVIDVAPSRDVRGAKFTVGVYKECSSFVPESTGSGRSDGRKAADRFLDRYNETGSLRSADYSAITRHASYFLGLIIEGHRASR